MHCAEAGWASAKQTGISSRQAFAADLIAVAGHSLWLHQTPLEDQCSRVSLRGEQWHSQVPRPRNSSVPSSRFRQSSGLCPETLLVSAELGGGAATGHLVTTHQGSEREGRSTHSLRLRVCGPAAPSQSTRYIRKAQQEGSTLWRPGRRSAPSLPSAVTRSQSA
jgi:hypothetical protein